MIINNYKLADGPIFRLEASELDSGFSGPGSFYTTQYRDKPEDCDAWGANVDLPNPPLFVFGVFLK